MNIRVMTFNIHHGRGIDGKLSLERIASVIEQSGVDVVALNEVDRSFSRRSKHIDQLAWLASYLDMDQAFGPTISLKTYKSSTRREYGNALLSRFPIIRQKNHPFTLLPGVKEGRALLEVELMVAEQLLKVYVTHLSLQAQWRRMEVASIIDKIKGETVPQVLMGDCNMKQGSKEWILLNKYLVDVAQLAGKGSQATFPSFRPSFQLDYIFINRNLEVDAVEVCRLKPQASDHLPLQAILSLKQNEG